ncbi:uncharacterized protein LOC134206083 [Armigeres subalbatus]|uniref:uncharacterized protein LOC134206083 n=1 Tax=Armigeres subalbatus TaxID=124917 RepID=UPI002ED03843
MSRIGFRGEKAFLLLYVDDILVVSRCFGVISAIKKLLKTEFSMQAVQARVNAHGSGPATTDHWVHAKRILQYLQGTADHGLVYERLTVSDHQVIGFADANWATDVNDRGSVSGLYKLYGATVSWSTRKQSTVSLSSTEAKCSALADAACEAIWIQKVLGELGVQEGRSHYCTRTSNQPSRLWSRLDLRSD